MLWFRSIGLNIGLPKGPTNISRRHRCPPLPLSSEEIAGETDRPGVRQIGGCDRAIDGRRRCERKKRLGESPEPRLLVDSPGGSGGFRILTCVITAHQSSSQTRPNGGVRVSRVASPARRRARASSHPNRKASFDGLRPVARFPSYLLTLPSHTRPYARR